MKKLLLPQIMLDVIKFTVVPASSKIVTLDGLSAPFAGVVEWGDGAASPLTSGAALSHTYADAAARQITVRGMLGGFWNTTDSTGKKLVTSLDQISSESLVTLQNTFRGCTALRSLPSTLTVPNLTNLEYTFYNIKSVTSDLTPLWLLFASKPHTNCFTNCFLSMYGQHGSGCPHRQYVPSVPGQTYFQKYGQSGCPANTYHPATSQTTYYDEYGGSTCPMFVGHPDFLSMATAPCAQCKNVLSYYPRYGGFAECSGKHTNVSYGGITIYHNRSTGNNASEHTDACTVRTVQLSMTIRKNDWYECSSACKKIYSNGGPSYYSCSHFGGNCKTTGCTRAYSSGQSAYYRCIKSGGTCQDAACQYPYANETSYNNARNAGWA